MIEQLTLLESHSCDVEWNESSHTKIQLAAVQSDKAFGLLGGDLLRKQSVHNITTKSLPAVKGNKAHVKLIPGLQPMFCKARKMLLALQVMTTEKLD